MIKKNTIYNVLILLPYFWLVTGLFLYKSSDKGMVIMMVIAVITSMTTQGITVFKDNVTNSKMLWVIFIITLYTLFSNFYHGISSREIRGFIALSVFLPFFPKHLLTRNLLITLTIIGSFVSFSSALYFSIIIELNRSSWPINAIPFATIAATFSLLSINLLVNTNSRIEKILLFVSLLLAISAVILSQTRGVWISLIITLVVNIVLILKSKKINYSYKFLLACLIFLGIGIAMSYQIIEERITETQIELKRIVSTGDTGGSIGLRLEMLRVAPDMIKGDLILGTGDNHITKLNELYKQGKVAESLYNYQPPHYHNQYIDKLIKNGLIGLVLFILLLMIPLKESERISVMNLNIVISVVLLFSLSSLTDAPFNHGQTLFIFTLLLYGISKNELRN